MGQLHEVTILSQRSCSGCKAVIQKTAWKRSRSRQLFCKACAARIDKEESSKSQRRKKT